MNEYWWLIFALANYILFILLYYLFGGKGLITWIVLGTVLANIQVVKTVEVFGLVATLGNFTYGTIFLATDSLNELYGKKSAREATWLGFASLLIMIIIMQIAIGFVPSSDGIAINESMKAIFALMPRIAGASLLAYVISQLLDIWVFAKIKQRFPTTKMLWFRSLMSTIIGQAIDTLVFVTIAFVGSFASSVFWQIMLTTYLIKLLVSLFSTPVIYLIKHIKPLIKETN